MDNLKIIVTSDGSHSVLNTRLNETYHSQHGALQESVHVFIQHGLEFFLKKSEARAVSILEVGFGTGLNALLTLQHALGSPAIFSYTSIEAFPLEKEIWSALNYADALNMREQFVTLHEATWNSVVKVQPNFELTKLKTTLQDVQFSPGAFDVIFFDAFAPNKQPEMWELPMLQKATEAMRTGGIFVTYCAKGQLKRDLKSLGLQVETLPGPPGKKEMVRALKI